MANIDVGGERIDVEAFLPQISTHIKGVSPNFALQVIVDAIITIARETGIMKKTICLPLKACIGSYRLDTSPDIPIELTSVQFQQGVSRGCAPCGGLQEDLSSRVELDLTSGVVYVDPPPKESEDGMVLELVVKTIPQRDTDTVPKYLYDVWADAIYNYALAQLLAMTDKPWYDANGVKVNMSLYRNAAYSMRRSGSRKGRTLNIKLRPAIGLRGRR